MSRRSVRRAGAADVVAGLAQASETKPATTATGDVESTPEVTLPRDHPKWMRDRFTISVATKALLDRLAPLAIRVFGFWEHRIHRVSVGDGAIEIDVSGSYRYDRAASTLEKLPS
ncbi:MAG: hypothetical protein IAI50_12050 [Candidatus Eremiobacteraeota bacterium]|nr:hypothetical protein [Candidatus Eremiobacteraeota bacterium]